MAIEPDNEGISVSRQCELLGLPRSSLYYRACPREEPYNERLMRLVDEQYMRTPFYGVRRMTESLRRQGHAVNPKRIRRLMRQMGLEAIYPRPRHCLSQPGAGQKRYPYLLRGLEITRPDQVWAADITYVRMYRGWLYLVAILDWFSRYVLSWELSVSLEADFCVSALERALAGGGVGRRSSTATRAASSPARRSAGRWRPPACESAWTAVGGCSTTSSWSVCGGR